MPTVGHSTDPMAHAIAQAVTSSMTSVMTNIMPNVMELALSGFARNMSNDFSNTFSQHLEKLGDSVSAASKEISTAATELNKTTQRMEESMCDFIGALEEKSRSRTPSSRASPRHPSPTAASRAASSRVSPTPSRASPPRHASSPSRASLSHVSPTPSRKSRKSPTPSRASQISTADKSRRRNVSLRRRAITQDCNQNVGSSRPNALPGYYSPSPEIDAEMGDCEPVSLCLHH